MMRHRFNPYSQKSMKYVFGNWKMNGIHEEAVALAKAVGTTKPQKYTQVAIFPPFINLHLVKKALSRSSIALGAQDCSPEENGAFTGDISAGMLKDAGCKYVLVGHSERRTLHGESDETVRNKAIAAIKARLVPVICVGENLAERESGKYLQVITRQVEQSVPSLTNPSSYLIAYEPVWAIGSGKTPILAEISEAHKTIASLLYHDTSKADKKTAILYGGSVKANNACEIMATEGVDGVLVGGASLKADEFGKIIEAAGSI